MRPTRRRPTRVLSGRADELRQSSGLWVVPAPLDATRPTASTFADETNAAALAVLPVDDAWSTARGFGVPTTELAARTQSPTFVVHAPDASVAKARVSLGLAHAPKARKARSEFRIGRIGNLDSI